VETRCRGDAGHPRADLFAATHIMLAAGAARSADAALPATSAVADAAAGGLRSATALTIRAMREAGGAGTDPRRSSVERA